MKILKNLIDKFARKEIKDSSQIPGEPWYKEIVNFNEIIGYDVHPRTGQETQTTWGIIHYSKNGAHIVPARPEGLKDDIDISYAILAVQRALLGEVIPNLRAVVINIQIREKTESINFYFDQEISEEIYDDASCVITEIIAAFPPDYRFEERIERLDYPDRYQLTED